MTTATLLPPECCCDARKRRLLQMRNVGGHASQRDNCHVCLLCAVAGGNAVPPLRSEPLEAPPLRGGWEGSSKNGEMLGEMSGEVFRQHPTIRNAHLQRVSALFGEVLGIFLKKQRRPLPFLASQQRIGGKRRRGIFPSPAPLAFIINSRWLFHHYLHGPVANLHDGDAAVAELRADVCCSCCGLAGTYQLA